jgi:predicted ArsR family transcriptional regulator
MRTVSEEVYRALSSKSRIEIIKLLYNKPLSIDELAEKLQLRPITVRHHIHSLVDANLLESYEERSGIPGRPKTYYRIAESLPIVSFPQRRYLTLSSLLIAVLQSELGTDGAKKILSKAGREMGTQTVNELEQKNKIKQWTPKEFEEIFVKYLREAGAEPEVTEKTEKKVTYRLHNCIFFELATKSPDLMCDVLHKQFQKGVSNTMGRHVKEIQTSCMGHGDAYCEHVVEFDARTLTRTR